MSSFQFNEIDFSESYNFQSNTYLWIWHANKIPPHIGVSSENLYFSLKVSGKDVALPCERTLGLAVSKNISMLLIELKCSLQLSEIQRVYSRYDMASPKSSTCLSPIKQLFELPNVMQLSELLDEMEESKQIQQVFGIHLPLSYDSLPDYSVEEIQNRLLLLSNAQGNTHILKNG